MFWALLFLEASRLYFYIRNYEHFISLSFFDILYAFVNGIRFDYYSFIVIGSIFVVLSFFPCKCFFNKHFRKILKYLFVIFTAFILAANFIDAEYFKFTGKRSTYDIVDMLTTGGEAIHLLPQFMKDFWVSIFVLIIFIFLLARFYPKCNIQGNIPTFKIMPTLFSISGIFFVLFILARGFGIRPITIINAVGKKPLATPLILNTSFSILQTVNQKNLQPITYFTEQKVKDIYLPLHCYLKLDQGFRKKNIVILILESFGKEYVGFYNHGKSYTPFLDSLLTHALTFRYSLANGKKSVEAIPAIIASIPNLQDNPFIFSPYISNRYNSLASILTNEGYQTAFFHGGKNGTMGFESFTKMSGFQSYFGKNEYPNPDDYDGHWGIYDEPYLQYIVSELNDFKQPFFITVFTLSSHHPYKLPKRYQNKFPEGSLPIHKVIAYSDYALKRFFETAKKQLWYENTLFVLVADHTSISDKPAYQNILGTFEITMAYFSPDDSLLTGKSNMITQQIDIMPSILDYLHYPHPFFSFGHSVFNNEEKHFAVTYLNNLYEMVLPDRLILFDGNNINGVYSLPEDSLLKNNIFVSETSYPEVDTLKAFLQIYTHSLINNKMLPLFYGKP